MSVYFCIRTILVYLNYVVFASTNYSITSCMGIETLFELIDNNIFIKQARIVWATLFHFCWYLAALSSLCSDTIAMGFGFLNCVDPRTHYLKPSSQYDTSCRKAPRCDALRRRAIVAQNRLFFYSEQRCTTCRSRRRCHTKLYRRAGKFWKDVASRRGALRRLVSYCELGLTII